MSSPDATPLTITTIVDHDPTKATISVVVLSSFIQNFNEIIIIG